MPSKTSSVTPTPRSNPRWKALSRLAVMSAVLWAGCLPSVQSLFEADEGIIDPKLIGTWVSNDGGTWTFARESDHRYALSITEKEKRSPFIAVLGKVGDQLYLDIQPSPAGVEDCQREGIYESLLVYGHFFFQVKKIDTDFQLRALNGDWLKKLLEQDRKAISFQELPEERIVLTASTQELKKFIAKYGNNADSWGELTRLERSSEAAPAK